LTKKRTFNFCGFFFCGLKMSTPKKIVCFTGSNNRSDVTINNCCILQWSLEVKTYLVLWKVSKVTPSNTHLVNFKFVQETFFSLFSRSILLTGNTKSTVGSISVQCLIFRIYISKSNFHTLAYNNFLYYYIYSFI
jgi:hypothetical protein